MKWIVILSIAALIATGIFLSKDRIWLKAHTTSSTYGNQAQATIPMYRSRNGDVLVDLREHGESLYIVSYAVAADKHLVGNPNVPNFHFFWGFALSENAPEQFAPMGGPKDETLPKLVVSERSLEFTSHKGVRVSLSW